MTKPTTAEDIALALAYARMRAEWAADDLARGVGTVAMQLAEIRDAAESRVAIVKHARSLGMNPSIPA